MTHKNVLLIVADDLGKYVGCYGSRSIKTPHLDKLASQGSRFDLAFASTPSCSGSRTTIYTGLHTHENGQYGLQQGISSHFQTFNFVDSGPRLFNDAGYLTGIIGKVHVGPSSVYPWTVFEESESRDVAWVSDRAGAFFDRAKKEDKPFHLTIGWIDPHRVIQTRGGFGNDQQSTFDKRVKEIQVGPEDVEVPKWLSDVPEVRAELVEYYKSIYRMDQGIGFVLGELEKAGLADDTLVIFTSDNGPPFINSKTTMYDAGSCLPLVVRKPGAGTGVTNPNMVSFIDILPTCLEWAGIRLDVKGSRREHELEKMDQKPSPPRRGRSFLSIIDRDDLLPSDQWQHHIFGSHTFHEWTNYWPTRVLRDRRYKYHRNIAWRLDFPFASDLYASLSYEGMRKQSDPVMIGKRSLQNYLFRPAEELYDLENDPEEVENLADKPEHRDRLKAMRRELELWQQLTRDKWLYRDGQSLRVLDRYAKEGLKIPDRFDADSKSFNSMEARLMSLGPDSIK